MSTSVKAVLFDVDGTLVDTNYLRARRRKGLMTALPDWMNLPDDLGAEE